MPDTRANHHPVARWTAGDASPSEQGGFVAYGDYLALQSALSAAEAHEQQTHEILGAILGTDDSLEQCALRMRAERDAARARLVAAEHDRDLFIERTAASEAERDRLRETVLEQRDALSIYRAMHGHESPVSPVDNEVLLKRAADTREDFYRTHKQVMDEIAALPNYGQAVAGWPEDAAHENGNYQGICLYCGGKFIGHKRRVCCKACALPPPSEKGEANG